ncbi:hypothetical protein D9613_001233 [Agrocybe pediades]|uniref:Phosphatidylserine decarboxylase n=1 Tax=Agrocybe pediades TaxID=84607 RepID=A0A8H4R120_9AGAR|nr:hypothetical protein D9613_001233 [Agrocybe pediades]
MAIESAIVNALVSYINQRPDVKEAFNAAFDKAASTGILKEYNISTLDDYFVFYDNLLKWTPRENSTGTQVYEYICLSYFILDQYPVVELQTPIMPQGGWTWLSQWIISYAKEVGKFMDTPESINDETLKTFYASEAYHMDDYVVPEGGWKTFNEFFARHIKPSVRPIDEPGNSKVIVSAADSAFGGSWPIDEYADTDFTSKGIPWNISQLLEDTVFGDRFKGGVFMHAFLNTTDYHRQHAPVSGTVIEAKVIPGVCYLEVTVGTDANGKPKMIPRRHLGPHPHIVAHPNHHATGKHRPRTLPKESKLQDATSGLQAPDSPGYQFIQARGLVVIDSPDLGLVGVLPIGMAEVSSVVLSVKPGDVVKKGDEISYFQMGGSDIVMVFEKKANVTFPNPTTPPTHYNFGEKIAEANPGA